MRAIDIIIRKRDKKELSKDEIEFFIEGVTSGSIPDYQISAWAMAVLLNGMTPQETTYLTLAMANSGDILDLSSIAPIVVDKHSSGGVGDKNQPGRCTNCGFVWIASWKDVWQGIGFQRGNAG